MVKFNNSFWLQQAAKVLFRIPPSHKKEKQRAQTEFPLPYTKAERIIVARAENL